MSIEWFHSGFHPRHCFENRPCYIKWQCSCSRNVFFKDYSGNFLSRSKSTLDPLRLYSSSKQLRTSISICDNGDDVIFNHYNTTLSFHNHTEPFLAMNSRYLVNDLVQCVENKRLYQVIHMY